MFWKSKSLDRTFQDLSHGIFYFPLAQKLMDFVIFTYLGILGVYLDMENCEIWNLLSSMFKDQLKVLYLCRDYKILR